MWLRSDILGVFFDERRGGMPVRDSFGFIRAASVEIARAWPPPFFQSLNERNPHITKHSDSKLMASGVMQRGEKSTPHTYEMTATLKENSLNLMYRLNVANTEKVLRSKVWLWTSEILRVCSIGGSIVTDDLGKNPYWNVLYLGKQLKDPITLFGSGSRLEISGSTTPPIYARVCSLKKYPRLEVVYGWARNTLSRGTYSGDLTLTYGR